MVAKTLVVTIPVLSAQPFPVGVQGGNWFVVVMDQSNQIVASGQNTAPTVNVNLPDGLPSGTYNVTGQRLDSNNNPIGGTSSGVFTFTADASPANLIDVADSSALSMSLLS